MNDDRGPAYKVADDTIEARQDAHWSGDADAVVDALLDSGVVVLAADLRAALAPQPGDPAYEGESPLAHRLALARVRALLPEDNTR